MSYQLGSEWVASLEDVGEICDLLGTFRERLRYARHAGLDSSAIVEVTGKLETRLEARRSELT